MADYTIAQLLEAFRTDHPELRNVADHELIRAIGTDSPDLVKNSIEFRPPEQAAPLPPSSLKTGADVLMRAGTGGAMDTDNARSMLGGMWDAAKGTVSGLYHAATDPATPDEKLMPPTDRFMQRVLINPQVEQAKKAREAYNQKRYSEAVGHGVAAVVPGAGPAAANIGEQAGTDPYGAAGSALVTFGAPEAIGHAAGAVSRATPERVTALANRAREIQANAPGYKAIEHNFDIAKPLSTAHAAIDAGHAVVGAGAGAVANVAELVAKAKIARQGIPAPHPMAAQPPVIRPANPNPIEVPPPVTPQLPNVAPPTAEPITASNYQPNVLEMQGQPESRTAPAPGHPLEAPPTAAPQLPNVAQNPQAPLSTSSYQPNVMETTGDPSRYSQVNPMEAPPTAAAPQLPNVAQNPQAPLSTSNYQPSFLEMQAAPQRAAPVMNTVNPMEVPPQMTPELPNVARPAPGQLGVSSYQPNVMEMQEPPARPDVQAPGNPMEAPPVQGSMEPAPLDVGGNMHVLPPEVLRIQEALTRRGSPTKANLAIDNAQYLQKIAPELAGLSDVPNPSTGIAPFDQALVNRLDSVGNEIDATLRQNLPDGKLVDTAVEGISLEDLAAETAGHGDFTTANKIRKIASIFDKSGMTSAEKVMRARQELYNSSLDITEGAGRDAYQVFKDLSEKIAPGIKELNQKYFTLKTAAEIAGLRTGGFTPESRVGMGLRPKADLNERITAAKEARKKSAK